MTLPHERPENRVKHKDDFTTMDDEAARHWDHTHSDYGEKDDYGNEPVNPTLPRNVDPPPKKK